MFSIQDPLLFIATAGWLMLAMAIAYGAHLNHSKARRKKKLPSVIRFKLRKRAHMIIYVAMFGAEVAWFFSMISLMTHDDNLLQWLLDKCSPLIFLLLIGTYGFPALIGIGCSKYLLRSFRIPSAMSDQFEKESKYLFG